MTVRYTEEQRVAVESLDLSTVLTAGAGSGKTRVLVGRYINLLKEKKADVSEILAITFTEKAAAEMNERIREAMLLFERSETDAFQKEYWRKANHKMTSASISTIDAFCRQIVMEFPIEAGIDPFFSISDEIDSYKRARFAAREAVEEMLQAQDQLESLITQIIVERYGLAKIVSHLVYLHEKIRVTGDSVSNVDSRFIKTNYYNTYKNNIIKCNDDETLKLPHDLIAAHFLKMCEKVEESYINLGVNGSQLDFVELEIAARRVLNNPVYGDIYRKRYKFVMVDEYQDVNELQDDIIRLLTKDKFSSKLFVVGDPKQSIYRFRGGNLQLFKKISNDVKNSGGLNSELTLNFRSKPQLIQFTNKVFESVLKDDFSQARWIHTDQEDLKTRAEMAVILTDDNGEKRTFHQARFVAKRIAQMVNGKQMLIDDEKSESHFRSVEYKDIAILMRSMNNVKIFEEALAKEKIPYHVVSGSGFYERKEVWWFSNILSWLLDESDDVALLGALRSPIFVIDDETLTQISLRVKNKISLWKTLLSFKISYEKDKFKLSDSKKFEKLYKSIDVLLKLRDFSIKLSPIDIIDKIIELTGFERKLLSMPDGIDMMMNIQKLLGIMKERETKLSSIYDIVIFLNDMSEISSKEEGLSTDDTAEDVVKIMTVHKSKGLEFPVVFVPEVFNEFGKTKSLIYDSNLGISIKLGDIVEDNELSSKIHDTDLKKEEEENVRCLYVALTRAENYLVVVGSMKISKNKKLEEKATWGNWILKTFCSNDIEFLYGTEYYHTKLLENGSAKLELKIYDISKLTYDSTNFEFENLQISTNLDINDKFKADDISNLCKLKFNISKFNLFTDKNEIHIPVTALVDYSLCKRKYVYSFVEGIKPENLPNQYKKNNLKNTRITLSANKRGTIVHSICSKLSNQMDVNELLELELKKFGIRDCDLVYEAEKIMPLIKPYIRDYSDNVSVKEVPFILKIGRFNLSGIIDRLELFEDKAIIYDFKTDDILDFNVDSSAKMYDVQLKAYCVAVWRNYTPKKLMTRLHFLKPDKVSSKDFEEKDILNAEEFLLKTLNGIDNASMNNTEIKKCSNCKECAYSVLCRI